MVELITNPEFPDVPETSDAPETLVSVDAAPAEVVSEPENPPLSYEFMDYGFEGLDTSNLIPPPPRVSPSAFQANRFILNEGDITKAFEEYGKAAPTVLASQVATEVSSKPEFKGQFTYETLRDGTAPIFDSLPEFRDVPVFQRGLTDREILNRFANTEDTNFLEQFTLYFPQAAFTVMGMEYGARKGAALARKVPIYPTKIGSAASATTKIGLPVVTTIGGGILANVLGDEIRKNLLQGDTVYNPADRTSVVMGRTLAETLTGSALGYRIGKGGIDLGYAREMQRLSNLPSVSNVPIDRSRSLRILRGTERLVGDVGKSFRERPLLSAGAEAIAGGGTMSGVYLAAENFPGSPEAEFLGATLGPTAPAVIARITPGRLALDALTTTKSAFKNVPEEARIVAAEAGRDKTKPSDFVAGFGRAFRAGKKRLAGRILLEGFITSMKPEQIDEFLKTIATQENGIWKATPDAAFNMRKNPVISRMMKNLEELGYSFEAENLAAMNTQAKGLVGIADSAFNADTNQGYLLASEIIRKVEEAKLQKTILDRVEKLQSAYSRISSPEQREDNLQSLAKKIGDSYENMLASVRATSKRLYESVGDHDIIFDLDSPPVSLGAVEAIGLPRGTGLSELKGPVPRAVRLLRRIDEEYDDFVNVMSGQKQIDEVLDDVRSRLSDTVVTLSANSKKTFDGIEESLKGSETSAEALQKAQSLLERLSKKDPTPETDELMEALNLKVRELKLVESQTDPNALQEFLTQPYSELKAMRSSLLGFARNERVGTESGSFASRLAEIFEDQMNDLNAVRRGVDGADVGGDVVQRLADASAYYRARQNIFNKGLLADLAATDRQGHRAPPEILLRKMRTLDDSVALRIKELQLAQRFTENPATGGVLPRSPEIDAGVSPETAARVMEGRGPSEVSVPSVDAYVSDLLARSLAESKTSQQRVELKDIGFDTGPIDVIKNSDIEKILRQNASDDPVKALDEGTARTLDLLPGLKGQLEDIQKAGADIDTTSVSHLRQAAKELSQKVYYKFAKGGQETNFLETLVAGFRGERGKQYLVRWNELLDPIQGNAEKGVKGIKQLAEEDPQALIRQMAETPEGLRWLEKSGVDIADGAEVALSRISPERARELSSGVLEEAKTGLRALIFDYAKDKAGFKTGGDYSRLYEVLFRAPRERGADVRMPSLMNWMVKNEIIDPQDAKVYADTFKSMANLQEELAGKAKSPFADSDNIATRMGARMLGAMMGGAFQRSLSRIVPFMGGSGSIQVPGYFASMSQNLLIDARVGAVQDAMFEILKSPAETARMVTALRNAADGKPVKEGFVRSLQKSFEKMGIIGPTKRGVVYGTPLLVQEAQEEQRQEALPETEKSRGLRNMDFEGRSNTQPAPARAPGKQSSLDVPQFNLPSQFMPRLAQAAQPAAPGPRPTGQANPQQRAGLASLFPNDPILGAGRNVG